MPSYLGRIADNIEASYGPELGGRSVVNIFMRVLLPAPLGPIRPKNFASIDRQCDLIDGGGVAEISRESGSLNDCNAKHSVIVIGGHRRIWLQSLWTSQRTSLARKGNYIAVSLSSEAHAVSEGFINSRKSGSSQRDRTASRTASRNCTIDSKSLPRGTTG